MIYDKLLIQQFFDSPKKEDLKTNKLGKRLNKLPKNVLKKK